VDAKRILREVKMLSHMKHDNIISMVDMIPPLSREDFKDVYMVLTCMDSDLHKILREERQLTVNHIQFFVYQILCGLKYMHSCGIIHRDLKPSNLLINLKTCELKICDFGLARAKHWQADMTEYVVTRWYRAPEIMLACLDYDEKVDVWACGCVMAEMYQLTPLFRGKNYIDQINLIFNALGTPESDDLDWIKNVKARKFVERMPKRKPVSIRRKLCVGASTTAANLLQQFLVFNPFKRISVNDAIEHPFFASFREKNKEIPANNLFDFSYENCVEDSTKLKDAMFKELCKSRLDAQKQWDQMKLTEPNVDHFQK